MQYNFGNVIENERENIVCDGGSHKLQLGYPMRFEKISKRWWCLDCANDKEKEMAPNKSGATSNTANVHVANSDALDRIADALEDLSSMFRAFLEYENIPLGSDDFDDEPEDFRVPPQPIAAAAQTEEKKVPRPRKHNVPDEQIRQIAEKLALPLPNQSCFTVAMECFDDYEQFKKTDLVKYAKENALIAAALRREGFREFAAHFLPGGPNAIN